MNFTPETHKISSPSPTLHLFTSSEISSDLIRAAKNLRRFTEDGHAKLLHLAPMWGVGRSITLLLRGKHPKSRTASLHAWKDHRFGNLRQSQSCVVSLRAKNGEPRPFLYLTYLCTYHLRTLYDSSFIPIDCHQDHGKAWDQRALPQEVSTARDASSSATSTPESPSSISPR